MAGVPHADTTSTTLVVGAGGLLGRALTRELRHRGAVARAADVRWADEQHAQWDLRAALDTLVDAAAGGPWRVAWAAGVGVTATCQSDFDAEVRTLEAFMSAVVGLPQAVRRRGAVFYASSAGGLYAGSKNPPFSEMTPPAPLAPYGRAKLQCERVVSKLTGVGVRVAIGRIANLYGPGQNLGKTQGLVSQLCRAHHTATPLKIYVSLDTMRDYLFVDDAARITIDFLDAVAALPPGSGPVTKILASGRPVSIAMLLGEMRRIYKKRVPVILATSPDAYRQARDLRFDSVVMPELDVRNETPLAAGIAATNEDIGYRLRVRAASR